MAHFHIKMANLLVVFDLCLKLVNIDILRAMNDGLIQTNAAIESDCCVLPTVCRTN